MLHTHTHTDIHTSYAQQTRSCIKSTKNQPTSTTPKTRLLHRYAFFVAHQNHIFAPRLALALAQRYPISNPIYPMCHDAHDKDNITAACFCWLKKSSASLSLQFKNTENHPKNRSEYDNSTGVQYWWRTLTLHTSTGTQIYLSTLWSCVVRLSDSALLLYVADECRFVCDINAPAAQ